MNFSEQYLLYNNIKTKTRIPKWINIIVLIIVLFHLPNYLVMHMLDILHVHTGHTVCTYWTYCIYILGILHIHSGYTACTYWTYCILHTACTYWTYACTHWAYCILHTACTIVYTGHTACTHWTYCKYILDILHTTCCMNILYLLHVHTGPNIPVLYILHVHTGPNKRECDFRYSRHLFTYIIFLRSVAAIHRAGLYQSNEKRDAA